MSSISWPYLWWSYYLCSIAGILPNLTNPHFDYGLYLIQQELIPYDKDLSDFSLPHSVHEWNRTCENTLLAMELNYNRDDESCACNAKYKMLYADQCSAFDKIIQAIESGSPNSQFFLQGPAGTGKIFLYEMICHHFSCMRWGGYLCCFFEYCSPVTS